jgi:hypothetical protein
MKGSLVAGLFFVLAAHSSIANADIQAVTGTAVIYAPGGIIISPPTPITGDYDTDTQQMTIHPWLFFGLFVNSQIQVLPPGSYSFPGVLPIDVGPGQAGGMITTVWGINTIPHGIVWDVISHSGGQHFEPVDTDGDGIPGLPMISGPFPGFTFVYEFDVGEPSPGIEVEILVEGGTYQQCNDVGGNNVELFATVDLTNGAELASIDWEVDGNAAGTGDSITPFLSLGTHSISVTATGISGVYDTASTTIQVVDTIKPSLSIEFVDSKTGQAISSVDGARVTFVEVSLIGSDVCDADVEVAGVASPVFDITGNKVIKIQGNNNGVDMPVTAIEVTATATDDSGNKQLEQAVLPIND